MEWQVQVKKDSIKCRRCMTLMIIVLFIINAEHDLFQAILNDVRCLYLKLKIIAIKSQ
ncbi:hypothetical protein JHK85_003449 [Glycine max]|nr:hypothetical protein JHK85_003449 [Glycine max]KHN00547.1 hypothetical protein glysoja_000215 [Glycine soja]